MAGAAEEVRQRCGSAPANRCVKWPTGDHITSDRDLLRAAPR